MISLPSLFLCHIKIICKINMQSCDYNLVWEPLYVAFKFLQNAFLTILDTVAAPALNQDPTTPLTLCSFTPRDSPMSTSYAVPVLYLHHHKKYMKEHCALRGLRQVGLCLFLLSKMYLSTTLKLIFPCQKNVTYITILLFTIDCIFNV